MIYIDFINSLSFWEKIKKQFEISEAQFICTASPLFKSLWDSLIKREQIVENAKVFLSEVKHSDVTISNARLILFCSRYGKHKSTRMRYINWNIERLCNS